MSYSFMMLGGRANGVWLLVGLAPLLAGCHKAAWDRLPMRGAVTLRNGEKLDNGSINFTLAKGHSGPSANAPVKDGNYQFNRDNGPVAGSYDVRVIRIESRSRTGPSPAENPAAPKKSQWELSAELSDDGTYLQDFQLD